MSILPGLENWNPRSDIRYDEFDSDSLPTLNWSDAKKDSLNYAYTRIVEVAEKHKNLPPDYKHIKKDYRSVAQAFFDVPSIFTNRVSKGVIELFGIDFIRQFFVGYEISNRVASFRKEHGKQICLDHEWPRAATAEILIKEYMNHPFTEEQFTTIFTQKYGLVNLVTSNENGKLGGFIGMGKNKFTDPKTLYQECGIELISLDS